MRLEFTALTLAAALSLITCRAAAAEQPSDSAQNAAEPLVIKIGTTRQSLQGHYEWVSITKERGTQTFSTFNFLINYDPNILTYEAAEIGSALRDSNCNWLASVSARDTAVDCPGGSPSGLLRIHASMDSAHQRGITSCRQVPDGGELFRIKFFVTNDRTYSCKHSPLRFCWQGCGDNLFKSIQGDSVLVSHRVFDFPTYVDGGHIATVRLPIPIAGALFDSAVAVPTVMNPSTA